MFCPKCGTQNPEGAAYCRKCGSPLTAPSARNTAQTPTGQTEPLKGEKDTNKASVPGSVHATALGYPTVAVKRRSKKPLVIAVLAVVFAVLLVFVFKAFFGKKGTKPGGELNTAGGELSNRAESGEGIEIKSDAQAAYFDVFVNVIPNHEDVPYVEITGDNLYPEIRYNWLTMEYSSDGVVYPYKRLRDAYSHALLDLYALNGKTERALEMLQYFDCKDSIDNWDGQALDEETQNNYDGLLWYLTFLNYHCEIETEEDDYGTLVHVKISNTDMVKLLCEELEKIFEVVKSDNLEAAGDLISGAFDTVSTYIEDEEINNSTLESVDVEYDYSDPIPGHFVLYPNYGNSLISKLNLVEMAGGLIFEEAKYQQSVHYWADLSDDGTLYAATLGNMLDRIANGDYNTVKTEVTFYADVDHRGIGYIPFDKRSNTSSFTLGDSNWGQDTMLRYLQDNGIATADASFGYFKQEDPNYSMSYNSDRNYVDMLFWLIMGWRGRVVEGQEIVEYPESIGYTGQVEAVQWDTGTQETTVREPIIGESVMADVDPTSGYYVCDNVLYELSESEATLVGVTEEFNEVDFTLPGEVNGRTLTTIGEFGLSECSSLKSVTVPDNVTVIMRSGICCNENLVSISLPETIKELGSGAFNGNYALQEINIPASIKVIPEYCFMTCIGMKEFIVPDTVEEIGIQAFDACYELHITVPKTVKTGRMAFGDDRTGTGVAELIVN